jgi:MFS family permease
MSTNGPIDRPAPKPSPKAPLAYEPPQEDRPTSAAPTEPQLERELPGGRDARGHDSYAALRYKDYRLFVGAFFLSVIGGQMQTAAVGWEIYKKTGSALNLGWMGAAMGVPVLLLALPAGHVADTHSRRRIMMATHLLSAACALGLAYLSFFRGNWHYSLPLMYALLALGNSGATFGRPARQALMPQLVPSSVFANAVTWNSSIFETASVIGPAVGGFVCARNIPLTYVISAACWIATVFAIWNLPDRAPPRRGAPATLADVGAGARFVWRSQLLLAVMSLDLFAVLLGGATFLLPAFAQDILHVGGTGFGWLRAAPAIGAVSTAVILAHRPPLRRAGRALLWAVAGFGCATIVFGLSRNYALSLAMLVVVGAFDNVSVVVRHTLIQLLTPDAMRGRVAAVNQIFIGSSNELGGLESGLTAAAFGNVWSVVGGGIGTILVVIATAILSPEARRLGSLRDIQPAAIPEAVTPRHPKAQHRAKWIA